MAPPRVTHDYVSANGDPPDPTLIGQTKWNADHRIEGLGSAAELDAGTSPGNVIVLDNDGKLPPVDGSQLTNLPPSGIAEVVDDTSPKLGGDLDLNGHGIPGIDYASLSNKPTLGTAAAHAEGDFATATQGSKADTAVQPGSLAAVATTGDYSDLTGKPTLGTAAAHDAGDFATAAQGAKADAIPAITANTMLVDNAAGTARESKTFVEVRALLGRVPFFYPEDYGAVADGVADCGPALRACADAINTAGGGVMALRKATYLIKTLGTNGRFFTPYANMGVQGSGIGKTTIKLDNNVVTTSFMAVFNGNGYGNATACHKFSMRDFTIDYNGQNNLVTGYTSGIYIAVGDDIVIDAVEHKNFPGSQPLAIGATFASDGTTLLSTPTANRPRITNNVFNSIGATVNSNVTDSSDIYVVASGFVIYGNNLTNAISDSLGTGIELHGTGVCFGNTIEKKGKVLNVGAYPNTSCDFRNNYCSQCKDFATVWNNIGNGQYFSVETRIDGNLFQTTRLPTAENNSLINAGDQIHTSGFTLAVSVTNNIFDFQGSVGTSILPVMMIGPGHFYEFSGNVVFGYPAEVILAGVNDLKPSGRTSLIFNNNRILNCCNSNQVGHTVPVKINAVNKLGTFVATGNIFRNDGGYMTSCFSGNGLPDVWPGQIIENNASINVASIGPVEEYLETVVAIGSAVALTTGTAKDVATLSLPPGDWDVEYIPQFTGGTTTTLTSLIASISETANTLDQTNGRYVSQYYAAATVFNSVPNAALGLGGITVRKNLTTTTTIRAVAHAVFATSTCSGYGVLRARRVR